MRAFWVLGFFCSAHLAGKRPELVLAQRHTTVEGGWGRVTCLPCSKSHKDLKRHPSDVYSRLLFPSMRGVKFIKWKFCCTQLQRNVVCNWIYRLFSSLLVKRGLFKEGNKGKGPVYIEKIAASKMMCEWISSACFLNSVSSPVTLCCVLVFGLLFPQLHSCCRLPCLHQYWCKSHFCYWSFCMIPLLHRCLLSTNNASSMVIGPGCKTKL